MADEIDLLHRIEAITEVIGDAHIAIHNLYRAALDLDAPAGEIKPLLDESTSITFTDAPAVAEQARALARDAELQRFLEPAAPAEDLATLVGAVETAESALTGLLRRQQRIARGLKTIVDRG